MAAGNPKLFEQLCTLLGLPGLVEDERFSEYASRHQHEKELKPILDMAFSRYTQAQALAMLEKASIPCGPINTIDRIMKDPQVTDRDMMVDMEHPIAGMLKLAGIPIKMSLTPGAVERPSPILGQHTDQILREFLGKTKAEIDELRRMNVL